MLTCSESARNIKLNCTISSKSHLWHAHRCTSDNQQDVLLRVLRQIDLLIKVAVAQQRKPFARHQNVYLYRYHVYIGSTLRAYYIIAVTLGPGGLYTFDGISMSLAISFSPVNSFIRLQAAMCLRESRHRSDFPLRSSCTLPPSRTCAVARAFNGAGINFAIKSSRVITERDIAGRRSTDSSTRWRDY